MPSVCLWKESSKVLNLTIRRLNSNAGPFLISIVDGYISEIAAADSYDPTTATYNTDLVLPGFGTGRIAPFLPNGQLISTLTDLEAQTM